MESQSQTIKKRGELQKKWYTQEEQEEPEERHEWIQDYSLGSWKHFGRYMLPSVRGYIPKGRL